MRLRARLDEYAWVLPETGTWIPSPAPGVERLPLDRVGRETARATSLVRYAPASRFSAHEHSYGEEFLVLDGEFADEHGRFPALTYVRNPHGSRHTPFSDPGCTIFVRLRQMHPDDQRRCVLTLNSDFPATGFQRDELHAYGGEQVTWIRAAAGERVALSAAEQAQEALLVVGEALWQTDLTRRLTPHAWIRVPPGCPLRLQTTAPCLIYTRTRPKGFGDPDIV
ncbi:MAG: cupin domain-containing protein [Pseudomonadales bacterium]